MLPPHAQIWEPGSVRSAVEEPIAAPLLSIDSPAAEESVSLLLGFAIKRILDVVATLAGLLLLLPLLLVVAVLIKLNSPGPVLFVQQRVGRDGRCFPMLKFRSMAVDAEKKLAELLAQNGRRGPTFKMMNDPRVTSVGRVLRAFAIDELPQLFNVLAGHMSLVGPRPPLAKEVAEYKAWQRRRLSVRPGLTCLWQVDPQRHTRSFGEWVQMDIDYIDRWSLALDAQLILETVAICLRGLGDR